MKREIKFRAWDKRTKEWCGGFCIEKGGLWKEGSNDDWTDLQEQRDIVLMQYTGLKDKKGKEIYEGDIIVCTENNEVYAIGNMTPLDRHLDMLADNIGYFTDSKRKKFEKRSPGGKYHLDDWVSWPEMYEVIGNIYENPELIS